MKKRLTRRSIVMGCVAAGVSIALLALLPSSLTGFGPDSTTNIERDGNGNTIKTIEVQQSGKTLWDWLSLLGVPLSLAFLGLWFQQLQQKRAEDETKEEVLQVYFDRLSSLLVDQNLIAKATKVSETSETNDPQQSFLSDEQKELLNAAVDVIRARTLSILRRFGRDGERKASVIQFLIEVEAISKLKLDLSGADLSGVNLSGADLSGADLRCASLWRANLSRTDLSFSLSFNPSNTNPSGANLSGANLSHTSLILANLSNANLRFANLRFADLWRANLRFADLSGANLSDVQNCTEKQLAFAVNYQKGAD